MSRKYRKIHPSNGHELDDSSIEDTSSMQVEPDDSLMEIEPDDSLLEMVPTDIRRYVAAYLLPSEIDRLRSASKFLRDEENDGAIKDISERNRGQRPATTMSFKDNMMLLQDLSAIPLDMANPGVPVSNTDLDEDQLEQLEALTSTVAAILHDVKASPRHLNEDEVEILTFAVSDDGVKSIFIDSFIDTLEFTSNNFLKILRSGNVDFRDFSAEEATSLVRMASKDEAIILAIAEGQNTLNFPTLDPISNKTVEIIKSLTDQVAGKDVSAFDVNNQRFYPEGRSLIHFATIHHLRGNVAALLALGADPDLKDSLGKAPIHNAVINKDLEMLAMLSEGGVDLDIKDRHKNTPLFSAVSCADIVSQIDIDVVTFLLENGAKVNERCQRGMTALMAAKGKEAMVSLLKRHGAEVEVENDEGDNALRHAAYNSTFTTIRRAPNASVAQGEGKKVEVEDNTKFK